MRSSTETLIAALGILARDIQSEDGVANAAIEEAAARLEELERENAALRADKERLDYMEKNVDFVSWMFGGKPHSWDFRGKIDAKRKEAKP